MPIFGIIKFILVNTLNEICFVYEELRTLSFDEHLFAYEVSKSQTIKCILHNAVYFLTHLVLTNAADGKNYVTMF